MFPHTTRLLQWFTPSLLVTPAFSTWAISVTPLSASSPRDIIFLWRGEWIRIWFFFYIYREGSSRDEEDSLPWCSMVVTIWVCFSITFVILSLFHCLCINSFKREMEWKLCIRFLSQKKNSQPWRPRWTLPGDTVTPRPWLLWWPRIKPCSLSILV